MISAVVLQVPLLERYVTVFVAKDPASPPAERVFKKAYADGDKFIKKMADRDWAALQEELTDNNEGLCVHSGPFGSRILIWIRDLRMGLLTHELVHAADQILKATGIGDNTEARAYVMEWLARESVNELRRRA